jgi:YD repeat-containing protein
MRARLRFVVCTLLCATSLRASETTTYTYDARGRLIEAARAGTVNNGVTATYGYDNADNRTSVVVTGALPPTPSFSIADAAITEGGTLTFTVTKSVTAAGTLTVDFATASGTATSGTDFTGSSGTLSFSAAETSKTVSVSTIQDSAYEGNETLTVVLSNAGAGSTIADGSAVGTINDDDLPPPPPPPSFAISDVSVTEGGSLSFTVTKTGTTSSSFSVNYASANVTAVSGSDYTATSGTLTFAAADSAKPVTVPTINDTTVESTETLNVNLSGATGGATITDALGVGTINDNDVAGPSFSVSNTSATEGDPLVFTVTRSGTTSSSVGVSYATANGTAVTPGDYTAKSGSLSFSSGQTSKTVSVTTGTGGPGESTETMYLNLSNATGGATITDSQGAGTLYNYVPEDPCPSCIIESAPQDPLPEETTPGGGL